jgi:pimeloyl-ACP methyl ester carboxylesterase
MQVERDPQGAPFVLIPGAGGMAWYWHRVAQLLKEAHQEPIAIDLPGDDASASLRDYADVRMLVFVNAMIPLPGETAGAWWGTTDSAQARVAAARRGGYNTEFDLQTYFLHDVPEAVLRTGPARQREQTDAIFQHPCLFERWPQIPIHVVASADDRFFPLEFQRRVARERLNKDVEVIPGGHLVALSRPEALVDRLLRFEREE